MFPEGTIGCDCCPTAICSNKDEDEGGSDVEDATDVILNVGGEINVSCDCCPGPVCSATAPNVTHVRNITFNSDIDEDEYEGWARYEHSHREWTGSFSFDISKQDPETAFALGRWMERLDSAEGRCQKCERNVREPAWLWGDGPRCPLCERFLDCTFFASPDEPARFVVECGHCLYDRSYKGEDAQWAADKFFDAV